MLHQTAGRLCLDRTNRMPGWDLTAWAAINTRPRKNMLVAVSASEQSPPDRRSLSSTPRSNSCMLRLEAASASALCSASWACDKCVIKTTTFQLVWMI
jgi:hypothetical protein